MQWCSLPLGSPFWCFRVSKRTHLCHNGWSGVAEVVLMQMRWCSTIFAILFGMKLCFCVSSTQEFFVAVVGARTKLKKKKQLSCIFCFASFILTYVFNLVHIWMHIKMQFLMQLGPSPCWLRLIDDSYQECLEDTSSAPATNIFQIA